MLAPCSFYPGGQEPRCSSPGPAPGPLWGWETHEQMNLIHGLEGVSLVSGVQGRERSRAGTGLECGFTSD